MADTALERRIAKLERQMVDQQQREKLQRTHHGSRRHTFGPGDGRDVELVFNVFRPDSSGSPLPPMLTVGGEVDDPRLLFAPDGSSTAHEILNSGQSGRCAVWSWADIVGGVVTVTPLDTWTGFTVVAGTFHWMLTTL